MYRDQFGEFVCGYWGLVAVPTVKILIKFETHPQV